jgi:hypothetical protein
VRQVRIRRSTCASASRTRSCARSRSSRPRRPRASSRASRTSLRSRGRPRGALPRAAAGVPRGGAAVAPAELAFLAAELGSVRALGAIPRLTSRARARRSRSCSRSSARAASSRGSRARTRSRHRSRHVEVESHALFSNIQSALSRIRRLCIRMQPAPDPSLVNTDLALLFVDRGFVSDQ